TYYSQRSCDTFSIDQDFVFEEKDQKWNADDPPLADHTRILRIYTDLPKQKRMITDIRTQPVQPAKPERFLSHTTKPVRGSALCSFGKNQAESVKKPLTCLSPLSEAKVGEFQRF